MRVTVFGIGYVGLVQGAVLAEVGHDVVCVDVDSTKVESLIQGLIPIYEPGLDLLVKENYDAKRLRFTTDAAFAVDHGEIIFIAVGTPPDEDGSADLKYVLAVGETVARYMDENKIVVSKSTVPVGTGDLVNECMSRELQRRGRANLSFEIVSNPEFLKEGSAVADCMRPDRIIIGTTSKHAEEAMRELYSPFNRNHEKILVMDVRSAELTKYAANCMLATKISFMNEMAMLAEKLGADIEQVRHGIGSDPRIGYHFIYPGCGYGGSCFPKDVRALIHTSNAIGFEPMVLKAVEGRNDIQKTVLFKKIAAHFKNKLSGKVIALWGLSFKPNTDDMREAPSGVLIEALAEAGAIVQAYDPESMGEAERIYYDRPEFILMPTKEAVLESADALVIVTEWQNFRAPDFELIKKSLRAPVIFDGRNIFSPSRMAKKGFTYYSIGR